MTVTKRNGSKEDLNTLKIIASLKWAAQDLNVSVEDVLSDANLHFVDGMPTSIIHDTMIKVTDDMSDIRRDKIDYDKMSARLLMQKIYHDVFDGIRPMSIGYMINKNIQNGYYSARFSLNYSADEIDELSTYVDYNRNFDFSKAGLQTLVDKYLIFGNGKPVEDPQTAFMAIAMDVHMNHQDSYARLQMVKDLYDALSTFKVSFPTPMMKSLRTGSYDVASCIVMETGDDRESWVATYGAITLHTMSSAGIGNDSSMVASIGDKIKNNKISHSGKVPLYKAMDSLVQTASQNGRRGAMVAHTFLCDPEIETILALKSPKTETAKRINDLKHSIKMNQYLMDRVVNNEDIYLFSPRRMKLMYESFHDNEMFAALYEQGIDEHLYSGVIDGRNLMEKFIESRFENGVYYMFFADNVNDNTPFKETVTQSQLCVTGDTKILTKNFGHINIEKVAGEELECWNGEEWSMTRVVKTKENQKFLEVTLSNGVKIKATPYHKWYTKRIYHHGGASEKDYIKRTNKLEVGDALVKFDLEPVPHGDRHLVCAYENGFFTADGTKTQQSSKIYLHGDKVNLIPYFCNYDRAVIKEDATSKQRRTELEYKDENNHIKDKFFIPDNSYSIKSRLDWLAGYFDGDDTLASDNGAETIHAVSTEKDFLLDLRLMIQELGVNSFVSKSADTGHTKMPKNDETGESKKYWHKDVWRISVTGSELQKLLNVGYIANRVMPSVHNYSESTTKFARVVAVEELNTLGDSYCGHETKRNKLMFNGQLTGNCQEISLPTKALSKDTKNPDIAVCVLSNINMGTVKRSELQHYTKVLVYALNEVIHRQDHPTQQANEFVRQYAALGIGVANGAYFLASKGFKYGSDDALDAIDSYMEEFMYYLLEASAIYASENDACIPLFHKTKYSDYNYVVDLGNRKDWRPLADLIRTNGLANASVASIPPSETSSLIGNMCSSIEPLREPVTVKDSKTGQIKQYAPDVLNLVDKYDYAFDTKDLTERFIKTVAVFQRWIDQGISMNTFYNPELYADGRVPMQTIWSDIKLAKSLGLKTIYYSNVYVSDNEDRNEECENCSV